MPVELLQHISKMYNSKKLSAQQVTLEAVGVNLGNIYLAFHEIAQLNISKKLHGMNINSVLEYPIISSSKKDIWGNYKKYEADVVIPKTREVYEVKPIYGEDPKKQLDKYKKDGNLILGVPLPSITDIPILDDLKMGIVFLKPGEANYYFYKKDRSGEVEFVTTVEALKIVQEYYEPLYNRMPTLIPGLGGGMVPVPVIP